MAFSAPAFLDAGRPEWVRSRGSLECRGIPDPAAASEMKEERLLPQLEGKAPTPGMMDNSWYA